MPIFSPSSLGSLRSRLAERLFGDLIETRVQNAVKVVDDKWWTQITDAAAPNDVRWVDRQTTLADALSAWRLNPLARQLVRLTRGFVLQNGITFHTKQKKDQKWLNEFWTHKQNRMARRLPQWCDALTLFGEVFPVLFFNHADGMSYVRTVPAKAIDNIITKPGDYETHLAYHQIADPILPGMEGNASLIAPVGGREWLSSAAVMERWASLPDNKPEMLHFAVNVPDGGIRGSGDLDPVLNWLSMYKDWLTDRWTINKAKASHVWDLKVEGADATVLRNRKRELEKAVAHAGGFYVHNEKESLNVVYPGIAADSVEPDGKAMRLMIAAGGGVALHHLGENDSVTRASSSNSDRGTLSHYAARQQDLIDVCAYMLDRAAWRAKQAGRLSYGKGGFVVEAEVSELTREDNLMLAQAASQMVAAMATAKVNGWVDDATAAGLMYKFAGEVVDVDEILEATKNAKPIPGTVSDGGTNPTA